MAKLQGPDLVRLTASQLQDRLQGGLTTVELVKSTLAQIDRHNKQGQGLALRAVISVAPEDVVLARAAQLDAERAQGKVRGPLHGIPILLKVCSLPVLLWGMEPILTFAFFFYRMSSRHTRISECLQHSATLVC